MLNTKTTLWLLVPLAIAMVFAAGVAFSEDQPKDGAPPAEKPSVAKPSVEKKAGEKQDGCGDCAGSCGGCEGKAEGTADSKAESNAGAKKDGGCCAGCAGGEKATVAGPGVPEKDKAPAFSLIDQDGKKHDLRSYEGKWVVLEWINHGCPFVKKHYDVGNMQALQKKYTEKGVVWLAICSSAAGKQGHMSGEEWKKTNAAKGSRASAVLIDADGTVGRLYDAKRTPTMVVIDPKGRKLYQGAIDNSPRAFDAEGIGNARCYVTEVLDAVMAGKPAPLKETKAYGCTVKYPSH